MKVDISRSLLDEIIARAAREATEICGLLLGAPGRIDAILPAANVAADPARHFEIDPAALIAAHRAARRGGPAIVGHYHSHPGGSPMPSATDAACAAADGAVWLIVAGGMARPWVAQADERGGVRFAEAELATIATKAGEGGLASPGGGAH